MRFRNFIGPSYTLQSVNVDCQRTLNLYPEINEEGSGNEGEVASLVSTPGLTLLCELPTAPVRGTYTDTQGNLWAVGGNTIYSVSSAWVATAVGTLNTSSGPVSMSDNGSEGVLVDGPYGYSWVLTLSTGALPAGYSTTQTASSTTGLSSSSNYQQYFTGSQNQLIFLPVATTMAQGNGFNIVNLSSQPVVVETSGAPFGAPTNYSVITTSAGTTTLTAASKNQQFLIGSQSQTVVMPVAATLVTNEAFILVNFSTENVTVQTSGGNVLQVMAPNTQITLTCTNPSGGTGIISWGTPAYTQNQYMLAVVQPNTQIAVVCQNPQGGTGVASWSYQTYPASQNTFQQIRDQSFLGANQVEFMDGYFIFTQPNSKQFFLSPLNSIAPFNGLDVASAEASSDELLGVVVSQENVYLFSEKHLEVWYDAGNANFPFSRVQNAVIGIGTVSGFSLGRINNTIFWLGQDKDGRGIVYAITGYQPKRISTFAIENMIRGLGDVSSARGWTYQQGGHAFYCLNLPGASTTWVFDATTQLWHERAYLAAGQYERHLGDCSAFAFNTNVVGDYSSGKLYSLDVNNFTDNGNPIVRERTAPHVSENLNRIFHSRFCLDIETGVGTSGSGQGVNPQAMLSWSNDSGHSWSNEHTRPIGPIGVRIPRVQWNRLGNARDRVYKLRISDPVKVTVVGAQLDVEEGVA